MRTDTMKARVGVLASIFAVAVLVAVVAVNNFLSSEQTVSVSQEIPRNIQNYRTEEFDIDIDRQEWIEVSKSEKLIRLEHVTGRVSAILYFAPNEFNLLNQRVYELELENMEDLLPGFDFLGFEEVNRNGNSFQKITYSYESEDKRVEAVKYILPNDERIIRIVFSKLASSEIQLDYDSFASDLNVVK